MNSPNEANEPATNYMGGSMRNLAFRMLDAVDRWIDTLYERAWGIRERWDEWNGVPHAGKNLCPNCIIIRDARQNVTDIIDCETLRHREAPGE